MKFGRLEKTEPNQDPFENVKEGIVGMNIDGFEPTKWDEKTLTMGREALNQTLGKKVKAEVIFDRASGEAKEAWVRDENGTVLQYMNFEILRRRQEEGGATEKSRLN